MTDSLRFGAMDRRRIGTGRRELLAIRTWLEHRIHEAKFIKWRELEESFERDLKATDDALLALEGRAP